MLHLLRVNTVCLDLSFKMLRINTVKPGIFYIHPKYWNRHAWTNCVDLDQTAAKWTGWSWSTLLVTLLQHFSHVIKFGKCPKLLYTKVSDKMAYANSVDPNQTAPSEAVWSGSTMFAIPLSILRYNCIKSKTEAKRVWNKVFETLGHLPY